jgi:hypothetical protein
MHKHENFYRGTFRSSELKSAGKQSQFSMGQPYWIIQNGRYRKTALFGFWPEKCQTKDTLFTVSIKYSKVVFYVIGAVTKPEILIDLVKVLPYTEIIHQLLFKCTRPK